MLQAKAGRLIVDVITESKTQGGLFLPETQSNSRVLKGKAISVGAPTTLNDGKTVYPPCSEGDIVFFKRVGTEIYKDGDNNYYFPSFTDILIVSKS